jgi:DegV family protein with EDD domain
MNDIHVVTDSSAQFPPPGLPDHFPVTVLPTSLKLPGHERIEGLAHKEGLRAVRHLFRDPGTAPIHLGPSAGEFAEVYERLRNRTDEIISIHPSSAISDALANATKASKMFLGRSRIQVIDSKMMSSGLGLLVRATAEAILQGADYEELVRVIHGIIPRLYAVFYLKDLMYLQRNGLTSRSQAILGNMLGLIPFLTIEEGHIIPMEKVRSIPKAMDKMIEFVTEFSHLEEIAILHDSGDSDGADHAIADRLRMIYPRAAITISEYNPAVASFVGLGSLGVVVLEAEEGLV